MFEALIIFLWNNFVSVFIWDSEKDQIKKKDISEALSQIYTAFISYIYNLVIWFGIH